MCLDRPHKQGYFFKCLITNLQFFNTKIFYHNFLIIKYWRYKAQKTILLLDDFEVTFLAFDELMSTQVSAAFIQKTPTVLAAL